MPQTQLSSRFGSDNSIFGLKETNKVSKSKFDFSKKNFTTIDIGAITPVDWFLVFPGDKIKLNIRYLLDTFPLEVPPMNNYFVRTHWYFTKMSSLWKGWNTFITKGRSGKIDTLEIPSLSYSEATASVVTSDSKYRNYSCPNGLMDYLGLKPKYYNSDNTKKSYLPYLENTSDSFTTTGYKGVEKFNILPMFNYQKIVRFNYTPSNLLQDNTVWFPEDMEDPWYIGYNSENLDGPYFVPESATLPESRSDYIANFVPSADVVGGTADNVVDVRQLRYGLYGRDYFTDAKPWLVRGEETELSMTGNVQDIIDSFTASLQGADPSSDYKLFNPVPNTTGTVNTFSPDPNPAYTGAATYSHPQDPTDLPYTYASITNGGQNLEGNQALNSTLNTIIRSAITRSSINFSSTSAAATVKTAFSANTLRHILALSVWQERNTLSGGNYNQLIFSHWRHKPKSPEYEPIYIGGTSDMVNFGQVIQNSSSVSGSPLGTKAGLGNASGGSDVFEFTADDYGIIMGVMIISPEVVYSQGVGHEWTDLTFDDQFQPEFANLGYQPILNKEIFAQGTSDDDDLFGYQTRYAYLKQRDNSVSGLFDLTPTQDSTFGPYVQARRFSSMPALSTQFVTMSPDNIDRSFLSFSNLPAFKLQFASDVSLIRALPYQSTPETFGF